jgi:hypothetical protein
LFKGGRRKGTVLKIDCAFNSVVNFCEIFMS